MEHLPNTRGFVCWDKEQYMPTLSACELIWTSFDKPSKIVKKSSTDLNRFHPTQKPVYVYEWILLYCKSKKGDKILDTHLGSGSIAIACDKMGFDLTACELDTEYFNGAMDRLENHKKQLKLF
jgi:site-specific DNA-methyltransferase (adenine-specific)